MRSIAALARFEGAAGSNGSEEPTGSITASISRWLDGGRLAIVVLIALASGVVWADLGRSMPVGVFGFAALMAGATSLALIRATGLRERRPGLRLLACVCVSGVVFGAGFQGLDRDLARARRDRTRVEALDGDRVRRVEARVRSRRAGRWGDEVELDRVIAIDDGPVLPATLILRLDEGRPSPNRMAASRAETWLRPGTGVRLGLRVRPLRSARNPGHADRDHARARRGIAAQARLVDPDWVVVMGREGEATFDLEARMARRRATWWKRAEARIGDVGPGSGLARAFALGDRRGLPDSTRQAFRRLGLSHLLAVSGLHVGFVAGLAGWLAFRVQSFARAGLVGGWPFDRALVVAGFAAAGYAWLTGAGMSVLRASMLFGLFVACRIAMHRIEPATALAWVGCVILLIDPAALFDVAAQLSFGACAALVASGVWTGDRKSRALGETETTRSARWMSAVEKTYRASLAVSIGTAPIVVYHGLPTSLLAPVLNVVAIPWTGFLVLPGALLAVGLPDATPAFVIRWFLWPANMLESGSVQLSAMLPESVEPAGLPWAAVVLLVIVVFGLETHRKFAIASLGWVAICLVGVRPPLIGPFTPTPPEAIFFDVGQGDASLVRGRRGTLLIDTGSGPADGGGGAALVRALRAIGVDSLDVLVVTHGDLDHRGGALRILSRFEVGALWLPRSGRSDDVLAPLVERAGERGTRVRWLHSDRNDRGVEVFEVGDLEVEVLWPTARSGAADSRNAGSMVLRVGFEETVLIFAADIDATVESALVAGTADRLDADVLKVAHHGSRSSSSAAFLAAVSPEIVALSAPCDATRGLPNAETLERLESTGAEIGWTGRDGALVLPLGRRAFDDPRASSMRDPEHALLRWGLPRACMGRP